MADSTVSDGESKRALSLLDEGVALARAGDKEPAREILRRVIQTEPENEDAWVWLAWVADSRERSAEILREAQALVPGSERLRQAMTWAVGEPAAATAGPAPEPDLRRGSLDRRRAPAGVARESVVMKGRGSTDGQPLAQSGLSVGQRAEAAKKSARDLAWQVDGAARTAQERISRAVDRVRDSVQLPQMVEPTRSDVRKVSVPILSILAVLALVVVVFLGIERARQGGSVVQAMVLPTLMPEATATPSLDQRTSNLWVQVDVAWNRENWDEVIAGLERIRAADPYSVEARARLAEAYFNRGAVCIDENKLDEAKLELDTAIRLDAASENLQEMRRQLQSYTDGVDAYWAKDWERATQVLRKLYKRNPNFRDTKVMLGESYYRFGIELQDDERWDEAETAYMYAVDLAPDLDDAAVRLQYVRDVISPPKRVEVDISAKTVTLFENHRAQHVFRICTGRPSAVTLPGRYSILDKMPEAYASKWDLRMPWWLGIYWAGGSENGFHALPILSNGTILWSGALGTGCSFGCIVLDTQDAITMYNWVEIGDVVLVNP